MTEKKVIDWELIERDYRAGIKSVREIASERGVSHTMIAKKAKALGWVRDLTEKIQQKAKDEVAKQLVASRVSTETKPSDVQTIEVYGQAVAEVDLTNRADVLLAVNTQRTILQELAALSRPEFIEDLERLGELLDQSGPNANGTWIKDKLNELYRYIISLAGRVKMAKDVSATYGVYIPLQRRMFGLDAEKEKTSEVDELLKRINQGRSGA